MDSLATAALYARQLWSELPSKATTHAGDENRKQAAMRVRRVRSIFFALAAGADDLIEIGAHHAEASVRFVQDHTGRRAFAYEANPAVCAEAAKMHEGKPIHFFNVALGEQDGSASFFVPVAEHLKIWASLKQRNIKPVEQVEITVPMQTLETAMAQAGAGRSAIWIDVEGAQLEIFRAGKDFLETSVDAIYVELYDKKMFENSATSIEVLAFLIDRGFVPVARDNQFPNAYNLVAVHRRVYLDRLPEIMAFMA